MRSSDWQPMETAPLNPYGKPWGPSVLIWDRATRTAITAYFEPWHGWKDRDCGPAWIVDDGTGDSAIAPEDAAAWMPIDPPEGEKGSNAMQRDREENGRFSGGPGPDPVVVARIQNTPDPWGYRRDLTRAADDVMDERARQISEEGWTPEHDDKHPLKMAAAGACYALWSDAYPNRGEPPPLWPWDASWWKPKDYRRDLVRAGALILAEIERLDRAALTGEGGE